VDLDLTLGSAGATLSGIAPRLYSRGGRVALGGEVALAPVSGAPTRYVLSSLPSFVDGDHRLSYEFPAGVYGSAKWDTPQTPPSVLLPFRVAGLVAGDVDLVLLRNGAVSTAPLSLLELGTLSEPGDFLASGWPVPAAPGERWSLSWSLGGVYGMETWERPASAAVGDWREADKAAIRDLLAGWAPAGIPPASPVPATAGVQRAAGGWVGIVPERSVLVPTPVPSGRRSMPTVFAAWRLVYDRVAGLYEPGGNPPCSGKLICSAYSEDGAQDGPLDALFAGLAQKLDTYSDDPEARLRFNGEDAAPQAIGPRPPWTVVNLNVPFVT